jgi:peptidoglycan/xylan/chitin deacetylase (PgdA/CDA1 family)
LSSADERLSYPVTPDGRYFVVRGRLWRRSDPGLAATERARLVKALMQARRAVGLALKSGDPQALKAARGQVNDAKIALGERGPVWWSDGAPDMNRKMVRNTPYADWYDALRIGGEGA